ncbi:MAG: tetratricopeptide repeat protein [Holosporaceae bacterium]|jgi:TolA-binding protein|nr:tetratricopeptide repeat protein [Holosporaceae bacterium]
MKKAICSLLLLACVAEAENDEELSDSVRELTGKVEELEKAVAELQKKLASYAETTDEKIKEAEAKEKTEALAGKTPEEILKIAVDMIEENNMSEARKILNAFVAKNPTNIYCGMMLFYVGNSYFMEKDYKNAAIEYMKGFKANPTGSKSAETLYKLALCFKQLDEKEKCESTLKKIIEDYAGSEFAKKASAELKKIGKTQAKGKTI